MNFTIKILVDKDAISTIKDDTFISLWKSLVNINDKGTIFQEPPFVISWYKEYANQFRPILCLGYNDKNELIGLIPLALSSKNGHLVHAGDIHAEYNGWISLKEYEQDFPIACLIEIKKSFKLKQWHWNWIPPHCQADWLLSDILTKANIYVKYRNQNSPIWDLNDELKLKELLGIDTIRNCVNRYKRKGKFYIERISDKKRANELLDILKNQCDFRQLIAHNVAPFEYNSNKINFYRERINFLNDNHFSCLWSENKPIALHFGACDRNTVCLGLTSFDPTENKNSPGSLLIIELANLMLKEGYRYLDLTPGNDGYKDKFSNKYQKLIKPTFYFNRIEKFKADVLEFFIKFIKNCFVLLGLKPEQAKNAFIYIKSYGAMLKRITLKKIALKFLLFIYEKHVYLQYKYTFEELTSKATSESNVRVQNYPDLLLYTGSNPLFTRTDILTQASKRFSKGDVLYSIVKENILAHYGWLSKGEKIHKLDKADMEFKTSSHSAVLYDFYTEPKYRRQGLFEQNVKKMLSDSLNDGLKETYICVPYSNLPYRTAIDKMGFRLFRSFSKTRFLWIIKKTETFEKIS